MVKKTSAHYQREYRRRLRENGLVKKEVWIKPENSAQLTLLEQTLRREDAASNLSAMQAADIQQWTTHSLLDALRDSDLINSQQASIELIDGIDPILHIVMHDYGDLPLFLVVCGEQIIVESVLWSVDDVENSSLFNETVLRTHKYFPLSTISLDKHSSGVDYYHMFGALSASSTIQSIVFEIEALANNVIKASEAYLAYLRPEHRNDSH